MRIMRELILAEQAWLVQRVIHYARLTGYIHYTSSEHIDWEQAIKGLSESMVLMINLEQPLSEFAPAMDFNLDPVIRFGIEEASRHRSRGVTVSMFFGMVKYFRRAFTDLIESQNYSPPELYAFRTFIIRFFDHVEMGFLDYWTKRNQDELIFELQEANRHLVQAKAQAEAVINGIFLPVLLVTLAGKIVQINPAAEAMLLGKPGTISVPADATSWPWIMNLLHEFQEQPQPQQVRKISIKDADADINHTFYCTKIEDLTEKFSGLLIMSSESAA